MTKENKSNLNNGNKTLIITAAVLVLVVILMYFHDQKQQRAYELRCLERRVELLEEWGRPRQNMRFSTLPHNGNSYKAKGLRSGQRVF